tara:strand:- start:1389 stop:1532 length:144 start_codon:yes stop_codon:yes gene_type:complete
MKLKKNKDEVVSLKKAGSELPRHNLQITLKNLDLPPYLRKEKAIVPR